MFKIIKIFFFILDCSLGIIDLEGNLIDFLL